MFSVNLHVQVNVQWSNETHDKVETFFLRPGGYQCSFICRTMYHAPILRRDIWDNCFVEVTSSGLASYPQPASPQADSMVLFGAFCNFCVQKKKKKLFQNDLNECIFVYVHEKWSDTEVWTGTSSVLEKTGKLVCLVAFCVFFFCFVFFLIIFVFFHFFYFYFFTEPFTSL